MVNFGSLYLILG